MYRVMIIDDEEIVRSGIKGLIDWESEDFCICGEGKDGREGLAQIKQSAPDLVLIDIKMPGLSGIEVIRQAKEDGFCGQFIVLTGYSEFEYARSALTLGVKGYLLKPIDEEELINLLREIRKEMIKKEGILKYHSTNEEKAKTELIRRILFTVESKEALEDEIKTYKMDINFSIFSVAICFDKSIAFGEENQRFFIKVEELTRNMNGIWGKIFMEGRMVLVSIGIDYKDWVRTLERENRKIKARMGTEHGLTIAVGHNVSRWQDICHSYEFATYLLERSFLFPDEDVLSIDLVERQGKISENVPAEYYEMLVEIGDMEGVQKAVAQFGNYCAFHLKEEPEIKVMVIQNLLLLKGQLELKYGKERFGQKDFSIITDTIMNTVGINELLENYLEILLDFVRCMGINSETVIKRVYYYMEKNYNKDLKLETIAKLFNYNSAYLGTIFRKEIGENFNNVLDTIRITNARRLLAETELKVYQVAEKVGYANIDYFHMKFKKYVGISPNEYRKK